eukprot:COSAG06_NODE_22022_length_737_cov_0.926332_2_plen_43_part_01
MSSRPLQSRVVREQGHFLYNERGGHLSMNRLSIRSRGCERSFV